ncbi:hypothetical protein [Caulobacter sp. S45]|uniref:hypothetical protein n=1 Tax=Caulobacter sp. S45 TaxID=1641861 RepID=UPI00131C52A0|nr:hypothetical protein [Caulobacter sp. S45]
MVDLTDADTDGGDAQDVAEVFDEDNTNIESRRQGGQEDAEQFEDLPDVYDSTRADGDDSEDDDEDDQDSEDEDEDQSPDPRDREDRVEDDLPDEGDIDGLERADPDEVELQYAGDLTDVADSGSSTADMESDTLSDDDLRELHYQDKAS